MEAAKPRLIVDTKEQKSKDVPDFTVGKQKFKSDLIPAALLIARYFNAEQAAIDAIEADLGSLEQQLDEQREEQAGEGGLLEEVVDDKGKISRKAVAARLKAIGKAKDDAEERKALQAYAGLLDSQADAKAKLKDAQEALEKAVAAKYGTLTEVEIKRLVVEDKWLAVLQADVQGELDRVSQALTGRIRELAERYAVPLSELADEVDTLSARTVEHLKKMGAQWK